MKKTNTDEETFSFHQWLNSYEFITKREFKEMPEYKQKNYKTEYDMWKSMKSQHNGLTT
ncbi:hypothetical protein [Paenibacillus odorifer]|uniref:hypothetical protein n=1 Tax=Paenibacillus odorifer TaxID=189426 RepID=UPI0015C38759|nr:hypothetical protein [Paenibacillus odorifer]